MTIKHVLVSGIVQGVGYRAWTRQEAIRRNLTGWVRNCADGRVEALLEGESGAVDDMLDAMHQGPALAQVERILVEEGSDHNDAPRSNHFEVTR